MKLLIIRHGDPDYSIDSLTEKGWKEAQLLAKRMEREQADYYYCSTLGRAKDTASVTLERLGKTAQYCEWLREFKAPIEYPKGVQKGCCWDLLPTDFTANDVYYSAYKWYDSPIYRKSDVKREYKWVTAQFDEMLKSHGYVHNGRIFKAVRPNNDVIALFCHFGVECVLLSHLFGVSPVLLWQHTMAAPTSVTTIYTEERVNGVAVFRVQSFGDLSHLYAEGEKPSFAGRFCERFDNEDERH